MEDDNIKTISTNRKARRDYFVVETYETGIALQGTEVKSIREGKANLNDSYASVKNNEVFLENLHIGHYKQANIFNHDPLRKRKLLLHKKQIRKLIGKIEQRGMTLVPLKLYFKGPNIKVELALVKGKKQYDKRKEIAKKDYELEKKREWKYR